MPNLHLHILSSRAHAYRTLGNYKLDLFKARSKKCVSDPNNCLIDQAILSTLPQKAVLSQTSHTEPELGSIEKKDNGFLKKKKRETYHIHSSTVTFMYKATTYSENTNILKRKLKMGQVIDFLSPLPHCW